MALERELEPIEAEVVVRNHQEAEKVQTKSKEVKMDSFFQAEVWWPFFTYLILAVGNFALGTVIALMRGEFDWDRFLDWLRHLGLEGAGLTVLALLSAFRGEVWAIYGPALFTAITAKTVDIGSKIKDIWPSA